MFVRQSLYAGLLTGAGLLVMMAVGVIWRGQGGNAAQVFPGVFAPLLMTGIVAVRRATPWIGGPTRAALAGALAGSVTALLAILIFYVASFINVVFLGVNPTHWDGFVNVLTSSPY